MIVWGGSESSAPNTQLATGGRYDPASNMWTGATTTTDAPTARHGHSGVWTGSEMIVWGGWNYAVVGFFNTGGLYAPDTWLGSTETSGAPTARETHAAVWTGTQMIIWGGDDSSGSVNTGGIYQPPIPAVGSYVASVTITVSGANNSPMDLAVDLTVSPQNLS
ncbi:MAG: hypothetical protein HY716_16240 [Planctomycetes bacterium]|nr:hypothetical protein [Planctomycetota bacterium]